MESDNVQFETWLPGISIFMNWNLLLPEIDSCSEIFHTKSPLLYKTRNVFG